MIAAEPVSRSVEPRLAGGTTRLEVSTSRYEKREGCWPDLVGQSVSSGLLAKEAGVKLSFASAAMTLTTTYVILVKRRIRGG